MANFFDSKLISNLKEGELPKVKVTIDEPTIINLGAMFVLSSILIFLSFAVIKRIK